MKRIATALAAFLIMFGIAVAPAEAYSGKYTVAYRNGGTTSSSGTQWYIGTIHGTFYFNITFNQCGTGYKPRSVLLSSDQYADDGSAAFYYGDQSHWYKGVSSSRTGFTVDVTNPCKAWVATVTSNNSYYS